MITQVQLFSIPVSNQDRAKSFYVDTLGFELLTDAQMGPDMRWIQVVPRGADTALTLVNWFPSMPAGSLKGLVLETDSLEEDVATLLSRGVDIPGGIEDAPWGRFVQFADPDGNGLILQATFARS
jgi:catechol 2,3-dioxygenase-like lactoylglutathione lyase family enzyme